MTIITLRVLGVNYKGALVVLNGKPIKHYLGSRNHNYFEICWVPLRENRLALDSNHGGEY